MRKSIPIEKICEYCGKTFFVRPSHLRLKFCSRKCFNLYLKNKKKLKRCLYCHKEMWVTKCLFKTKRFCSKECADSFRIGKKVQPCSEETKRKIGIANKGKNNGQWKGGKTILRTKIWQSLNNKAWRTEIFERDKFICQMPECDKTTRILNAHHIIKFSTIIKNNNIKTLEDALNCKELWSIDNGITLCEKCHNKTKGHEEKYINLFKEIVRLNTIKN